MCHNKYLIERFINIKSWSSGDVRAPHKPLLLLYSLAKFAKGDKEFFFSEIEHDIKSLLRNFGPCRNTYSAIYPFWRLQNDNIWKVISDNPIVTNGAGDATRRNLVGENARGSFVEDVAESLSADFKILDSIISTLLTLNPYVSE